MWKGTQNWQVELGHVQGVGRGRGTAVRSMLLSRGVGFGVVEIRGLN